MAFLCIDAVWHKADVPFFGDPGRRNMEKETKKDISKETMDRMPLLYRDSLPEEILKELTPEVRKQYFLWDEIMKREIELYPRLVLPIVKELFQREYPGDGNIVLLSTEYTVSRIHEKGEKLLHAIRSDLLLRIQSDLYHFECQIEKDGRMIFRMLEYDIHIALTHGKETDKGESMPQEFAVMFPKSAVLYLGDEGNVPAYETCTLYFQDGTEHVYCIPVMKVQEYSPEEIEEKHLDILVPFLPVRFRKQIGKLTGKDGKTDEAARERVKQELTEFLLECKAALIHEGEKGILSESAWKDIWEYLWKVCGYLLGEDTALYGEVSAEVEPAIKLSREIIAELREDIQGFQESNQELQESNQELQKSNKELQESNKELRESKNVLHQELENACRRMIDEAIRDGKSTEETENMLIRVFSLTKKEAEEKVKEYRKNSKT